jgi:hypothetical protein
MMPLLLPLQLVVDAAAAAVTNLMHVMCMLCLTVTYVRAHHAGTRATKHVTN